MFFITGLILGMCFAYYEKVNNDKYEKITDSSNFNIEEIDKYIFIQDNKIFIFNKR